MEEQLSFVLKLSLEEMALRRVVVNLWSKNDVLRTIRDFRFEEDWPYPSQESEAKNDQRWRETVEATVEDKVSKLALPESLKTRMMRIVRPIGLEILEWKIFHEQFEVPVSGQLCWTSAGVVDYEKTAEKIVRLETLDVMNRYELACLYCLEDRIQVLWQQLSVEGKKSFYEKLDHLLYERIPLELCWPYILKGEQSKLDNIVPDSILNVTSFHQYAFLSSACAGNKGATRYFQQKLTDEERDSILLQVIKGIRYSQVTYSDFSETKRSGVLCYLLSQMPPEDRIQILKRYPGDVLNCLLDWPWQDFLLDIADFFWTSLPEDRYDGVLRRIRRNNSRAAYSFPKLLQDFVLRSPRNFRSKIVCSLDSRTLSALIETETIQLIFRNADTADRVKLVSSYGFLTHAVRLVASDECRTVEVLLREAVLSEGDKEIVKESFRECKWRWITSKTDLGQLWLTTNGLLFERFLELLDGMLIRRNSEMNN